MTSQTDWQAYSSADHGFGWYRDRARLQRGRCVSACNRPDLCERGIFPAAWDPSGPHGLASLSCDQDGDKLCSLPILHRPTEQSSASELPYGATAKTEPSVFGVSDTSPPTTTKLRLLRSTENELASVVTTGDPVPCWDKATPIAGSQLRRQGPRRVVQYLFGTLGRTRSMLSRVPHLLVLGTRVSPPRPSPDVF